MTRVPHGTTALPSAFAAPCRITQRVPLFRRLTIDLRRSAGSLCS